jgi:hypothetical protein
MLYSVQCASLVSPRLDPVVYLLNYELIHPVLDPVCVSLELPADTVSVSIELPADAASVGSCLCIP